MAIDKPTRHDIERQMNVWAAIREYVVEVLPSGLPGVLRTDMPAGTWEYVLFEPTTTALHAAAAITLQDKQRFLTVIAADTAPYKAVATAEHDFDVLAEEVLMTLDLTAEPEPAAAEGGGFVAAMETKETGTATRCRLAVTEGKGGERAAGGQVGVDGDMAVYDRIKTEEGMRRKGLGRMVMGRLGEEARKRGARMGWLIASPEGQKLYTTLGWDVRCQVLILGNKDIIKNP
ncbi:N-acetyltransferase GCN5 [Cordyceps fumosorosea ARSEF 2679]|uniref:N-acetyltransferase GCN5 n=1 Tax=Cordyceps fumosorosea (strain ARSEF 2679) TaxID=1081104 RepID=A0A167Q1B4_CORFA|nr:N-acetyltransferase GCN5 [Cordyceps fumosorosea ARSEF 2679]OAA57194.1 N-acetyltransferase GCN5 [Cordyceps fumosorosea ARSEF 2679]